MKRIFYIGLAGLILFEIAQVYFIMPMPGSQEMNSIGLAYALYKYRWIFRAIFLLLMAGGLAAAFRSSRWWPAALLLFGAIIIYFANFKMSADHMFRQPGKVSFAAAQSIPQPEKLVIGIAYRGEAKAYPVQYLGYHHQVRDSIGGKPVMITYCTVCRTGRVFEPIVNGKTEEFRLVGMDHYNAMFEDRTTGSWWRQATGEAIAGKLKGSRLTEFPSMQTTLAKWREVYPYTLVMEGDSNFSQQYEGMKGYESGASTSRLTMHDTASWQPKSWVIGVVAGNGAKAYDWNRLQKERIIHDAIDGHAIVLFLSDDNQSFSVLERPANETYTLQHDSLIGNNGRYGFTGQPSVQGQPALPQIPAYQEYWHSWKTFHPNTKRG